MAGAELSPSPTVERQTGLHRRWLGRRPRRGEPAAVVLNTATGDSRTLAPLYAPLGQDYPVLLVDSSNRGLSPRRERPLTLAEQVAEVGEVVREEELAAPVWIGSSAATTLACRAAAALPSGGLVLISPLFARGLEGRLALVRRAFEEALASDPSLAAFTRLLVLLTAGSRFLAANRFFPAAARLRLLELVGRDGLALAWEQTFFPPAPEEAGAAGASASARLGEIRCQVLALRAEEEMLQPPELLAEILRELATVTEVRQATLPGGHALLEESPAAVFAHLRAFLNHLTPPHLDPVDWT